MKKEKILMDLYQLYNIVEVKKGLLVTLHEMSF